MQKLREAKIDLGDLENPQVDLMGEWNIRHIRRAQAMLYKEFNRWRKDILREERQKMRDASKKNAELDKVDVESLMNTPKEES